MKSPTRFVFLKGLNIPIVVALIGIGSGVVGNWVAASFSAEREQAKNISEWRVAAYQKFFSGQAKLLQSRQTPSAEQAERLKAEYEQEVKEARFHIGVFASPEVIQALADWFETVKAAKSGQPLPYEKDVKIYQAIRQEMLGNKAKSVDGKALYALLFEPDASISSAASAAPNAR